jgi:hypothetical protein
MQLQRCFLLLAALLLFGGLRAAWGQGGAVTVAGVRGQTLIRRADGSPEVRARRGVTVAAGDIIRTGADGAAILNFPDGSQLRLRANSAIRIRQLGPAGNPERVSLEGGRAWARVTRGRRSRFEAGRSVAGVRSTEFDLQLAPDGEATLTVAEGEVRFSNEDGSVLVRGGQQSVARPGQAPTPPAAVDVPFIFQWINDVQPVVLLLETTFVSQDPERLDEALREAEALPPGAERSLRLGDVRHDRGELQQALGFPRRRRRSVAAWLSHRPACPKPQQPCWRGLDW